MDGTYEFVHAETRVRLDASGGAFFPDLGVLAIAIDAAEAGQASLFDSVEPAWIIRLLEATGRHAPSEIVVLVVGGPAPSAAPVIATQIRFVAEAGLTRVSVPPVDFALTEGSRGFEVTPDRCWPHFVLTETALRLPASVGTGAPPVGRRFRIDGVMVVPEP